LPTGYWYNFRPLKEEFAPRERKVNYKPPLYLQAVMFLLLHTKMGMRKNVFKVMEKNGRSFNHLKQPHSKLSGPELKGKENDIFVRPQIRKLV
jgi:hypothetical protein